MESLRLIPPVPMTVRKAGKSDWIDGIFVPKDTLFYVPVGNLIKILFDGHDPLLRRFGLQMHGK